MGEAVDGANPYAGLVMDAKGNLYGTTFVGGSADVGTVFKLTGTKETLLHTFAGYPTGGAQPYFGSLAMDANGNLYGTTVYGGASADGTVWKLTP
jgi:uncharacterized repeat protein (TIGR03803 family)